MINVIGSGLLLVCAMAITTIFVGAAVLVVRVVVEEFRD